MKQTITIENMSCQHCLERVTEKLHSLEGITDVSVDLEAKTAKVETSMAYDQKAYQEALINTIYQVIAVN